MWLSRMRTQARDDAGTAVRVGDTARTATSLGEKVLASCSLKRSSLCFTTEASAVLRHRMARRMGRGYHPHQHRGRRTVACPVAVLRSPAVEWYSSSSQALPFEEAFGPVWLTPLTQLKLKAMQTWRKFLRINFSHRRDIATWMPCRAHSSLAPVLEPHLNLALLIRSLLMLLLLVATQSVAHLSCYDAGRDTTRYERARGGTMTD